MLFWVQKLEAIAKVIKDRDIDAVLYIDRLDEYSVAKVDRDVIESVTRFFGPAIWQNTVLCLSRASESSAPPGVDFYEHIATRENQIKDAIAAAGGDSGSVTPALIENSSRCPTNVDGEKVVEKDNPWVTDLLEKVVETALNIAPYEYSPEEAKKSSNPNRRRKWLIPLIIAAQIGAKLLLDRLMDDDGCRGDENGPFDKQTVKERRAELREERQEEKKRQQQRNKTESFLVDGSEDFDEDEDFDE